MQWNQINFQKTAQKSFARVFNRKVLIPRITLKPKEREFPFEWTRRQFPVRVAFAMTVNKSQGQTLQVKERNFSIILILLIQNVGVWLYDGCFAHGQLYVAVSRVGSPDHIMLAIRRPEGTDRNLTENVVYKEVFD